MTAERDRHYPFDLARLLASRLKQTYGHTPADEVLVRLCETLYFASLRTDEGRRPLCTVNFVDADAPEGGQPPPNVANHWTAVPFAAPLPLDVRVLTKLARAVDPEVSSLNVYTDDVGELFIWGLVDQEPRHSDQITLQANSDSHRPGLFQATIAGEGCVSVHRHGVLWANLSRDVLVETHHDVLWSGPVHETLAEHLQSYVGEHHPQLAEECGSPHPALLERELLLRWFNSVSRLLVNVQHYRHGGGLVLVPAPDCGGLQIKHRICYDRLIRSVVGMVRAHLRRNRGMIGLMESVHRDIPADLRDSITHLRNLHLETEQRKTEILGCVRFIASLTSIDGVVLLDPYLTVHGFGVELRSGVNLDEVYMAGDSQATPARLRPGDITQFGTRHRAIARFCYRHPGTIGFAVSQDGDIQALMRIDDRLIVWENIDVALALNAEDWAPENPQPSPVRRLFSVMAGK